MEGNHNYIFHALKSMSPSLEADRIRREIETLSLQFLGLPSEVPKHDTVWDQRSMFCIAVVSPSCSKRSVSYENHHKTSSALSASKTGYSIVHQHNKSFTPFHICNRVFWLHLGLFVCFSFVGFFLLEIFTWLLTTISLPFINLCLLSCFFNPLPKVTNLTMVTPVIKSTHLTRVTCLQKSVVN